MKRPTEKGGRYRIGHSVGQDDYLERVNKIERLQFEFYLRMLTDLV